MAGSFEIEWQTDGILLMRRSGFFTVAEARQYAAEAKAAMSKAPPVWGLVVDLREASAQSEDVQAILQDTMQFTVDRGVRYTAIVSGAMTTNLQAKRLAAGPGLDAKDRYGVHDGLDDAFAAVRRALA